MHPYYASERGLVDDVIDPADTRVAIIRALDLLSDKRPELPPRKHGNPPA
jgi:acetyl-CoA carboxylase carboxyltransferase component